MTATLNTPARTKPVYKRLNNYSDQAFDERRNDTVAKAVRVLQPYANQSNGFDTIVTMGVSGNSFGAILAYQLDVHHVVIRKPGDTDNHDSSNRMVGVAGKRLLFVDDFTASGETFSRIVKGIRDGMGSFYPQTEFVGRYFYSRQEGLAFYDNRFDSEKYFSDASMQIWKHEAQRRRPKVNLKKKPRPPRSNSYWSASNSRPVDDLYQIMEMLRPEPVRFYAIEEPIKLNWNE